MKKFATLLTAIALLTSGVAMAETNGRGAVAGSNTASDNGLAWGIGLGSLAVIGVVVGLAASSASESQSFSQH